MKVKEVMSKEVKSLSPEMSIREALNLLLQMGISGLPVIDAEEKLVGMFTEKEVLKVVLPSYWERVGKFVYDDNPKVIRKKIEELKNHKVAEVMRREVISVNEDTALCEVARIMLTEKVRRIPVLDKDKKVVGIIAREDIVKAFVNE
ncbi:MAG: CBS domain-containing protein [Candidatus Omnitrophica bacterium]|nr:CBS domain-containing protein [Candidatus Omnitrophota bacterium]